MARGFESLPLRFMVRDPLEDRSPLTRFESGIVKGSVGFDPRFHPV